LDDLEGQYSLLQQAYRVFSSKAFLLWEKFAKSASEFPLVIYNCSYLYHLVRWPSATSVISVDCSFREQRIVNTACMELCHLCGNRFLSVIVSGTLGFGRRRNGLFFLATAGLLVNFFSFNATHCSALHTQRRPTSQRIERNKGKRCVLVVASVAFVAFFLLHSLIPVWVFSCVRCVTCVRCLGWNRSLCPVIPVGSVVTNLHTYMRCS